MLIGEVIQRIKSLYNGGVQSDDSRLSSRHIYNKLVSCRQVLITQQARKHQKISDWNFVVLPCVELIKVPSHECSCLTSLGCDVWRTKYPLPKPLTDLNKHLISFVITIDNSELIAEATREEFLYNKGNKYTSKKPKYIIENSHLYFPVQKSPGIIKIKFLPEDLIEAAKYPSFCEEECEDCQDCRDFNLIEFAIDGDLLEPVIQMAREELVTDFGKQKQDIHNDTIDK